MWCRFGLCGVGAVYFVFGELTREQIKGIRAHHLISCLMFPPVTGLPLGGPFLLVMYAPTLKRTP